MTASTTTTRRDFLAEASQFACAPLFLPGLSLQSKKPDRPRNLVLIELFGGLDSLSILTPRDNDEYFRARPTLAIPSQELLPFDDDRGFPSTIAPLHQMWNEGLVRIVEGVGYPNSSLSHFRAREVFGAAMPKHVSVVNGWVTRMRKQLWSADPNAEVLTHVGSEIPNSLRAPNTPVLCFERPKDMQLIVPCGQEVDADMGSEPERPMPEGGPGGMLARLRRTSSVSGRLGPQLERLSRAYKPQSPFPYSKFGANLKTVAALIQGGFGARVYSVRHGDFDMHTSNPKISKLPQAEFAEGISAFLRNLKGTSAYDDTLVLCYTEFGRRLLENSGGGCDHGAAGTMFLFGGNLQGGIFGNPPSLSNLDENGNVTPSLDFRSVYAAVIEQWFKADHEPIMFEKLAVPKLI